MGLFDVKRSYEVKFKVQGIYFIIESYIMFGLLWSIIVS